MPLFEAGGLIIIRIYLEIFILRWVIENNMPIAEGPDLDIKFIFPEKNMNL